MKFSVTYSKWMHAISFWADDCSLTQMEGGKHLQPYKRREKIHLLLMKRKAKCPNPSFFVTKTFVEESMGLGSIFVLLYALELEALVVLVEVEQLMQQFNDVISTKLPIKATSREGHLAFV